nr:McrC family protein [Natronomonas salsuginis]
MIESEINKQRTRLNYNYTADGSVILGSTHYVGIFSLPDGPTVEVRPKAAGTNLLHLYRYARGVAAPPLDSQSSVVAGRRFVDALATLYLEELETIWRSGLHTGYRHVQETEEHLRGRLNLQRQLQRQGPTGMEFECDYDELTADTVENRAVLYATRILASLVQSNGLRRELQQHVTRFRRRVTLVPVQPHQLDQIELTRLNDHYEDALRYAELIINGIYIDDFQSGTRPTLAVLIDMNRIFEAVVERAAREAIQDMDGLRVRGQGKVRGLVTGGKFPVRMRPDFVIRNHTDEVVFVGDAKWKTGSPNQADLYQLTAYQLADDVPGILVYPSQYQSIETEYTIQDTHSLRLVELPTAEGDRDYREFVEDFKTTLSGHLEDLIQ